MKWVSPFFERGVATQLFTSYFDVAGVIGRTAWFFDEYIGHIRIWCIFIARCYASVVYTITVCPSVWCGCSIPVAEWLDLSAKRSNTCYSASSGLPATAEALRYMAHTKQHRTYLPLYLPDRSRYSFTDPERMEGWVSPGPWCKEQLAHDCYATARSQRDSNPRPRGR